MILRDVLPSPELREYVRKHQIIRFVFGANVAIPFKVYSPRPEHCLIFSLRDQQNVGYAGDDQPQTHYKCTINGQHTVANNRYVARDFWVLQIVLQPSALFRLTGIPSYELTNTFIDAEAIWGKEIRLTHEQMCNTEDVEAAIKVAEAFLAKVIQKSKRDLLGIDKASQLILNQNQPISINQIANQACLSVRQFHRKFTERMGISPKVFDRIVRFERAFRMKNNCPDLDWLSISLACGYYDYQHLVKDYKEFTTLTPTAFYETDTKAPERVFGMKET
ncbi:MAG: helix-turn-helix domain-containing protein [Cytophagaceae bacterium]|nr:helix-turn-helix domain-containing protein [Cytophagaceae bacterium]